MTMPCNRAPFDRSRLEPATSRAFRNRKRISCHTADVATRRAPSFVVSAPLPCSPSARPPADRSLLRPDAAKRQTCAVLVVSHHLDGLRHRRHRELVASPCRPWGSPGCWIRARMPASLRPIPSVPDPPERSPPPTAAVASPRGHAPLPLPPGGDRLRGFDPSGSPLWPCSVAGPHHPRLSWVSLFWSVSSADCLCPTEVDRQQPPQDRGCAPQGEPRCVGPSGLPACPSRCRDVLASSKPPSAPVFPKKDRPHRRSDPQRTCCDPQNLTAPRQTPRHSPWHQSARIAPPASSPPIPQDPQGAPVPTRR